MELDRTHSQKACQLGSFCSVMCFTDARKARRLGRLHEQPSARITCTKLSTWRPLPKRRLQGSGEHKSQIRSLLDCCWVAKRPRNMLIYLRDGSAWAILRAATLRYKLQINLSISVSHSILTPGQLVPALTPDELQGSHWSANL